MDLYKKYDRNHKKLKPWIAIGGSSSILQRVILTPLGAQKALSGGNIQRNRYKINLKSFL